MPDDDILEARRKTRFTKVDSNEPQQSLTCESSAMSGFSALSDGAVFC